MACLVFGFEKIFVYIYSFFHILLWGVIHFQQIYLESVLLFAMCGDLHLTYVWLCMSVGFAVTVQWPISSKRDFTIQFYFFNTYPFSMSLKTIHFATYLNLQNTWKIWLLVIKKFEAFCFLQYVNCQFKCKVQVLKWIIDQQRMKMVIALCCWFYCWHFMEFQRAVCFSKRFTGNFHFWKKLSLHWLCKIITMSYWWI